MLAKHPKLDLQSCLSNLSGDVDAIAGFVILFVCSSASQSVKKGKRSLCGSSKVFLVSHFTARRMWTLEGATFPQILKANSRACLPWRVQRESAVSTIHGLASSFGTVRWWRWACLQSSEHGCPGCALQSPSLQLVPLAAVGRARSTLGCRCSGALRPYALQSARPHFVCGPLSSWD